MKRKFCFILPNIHGEFSGGAETQCFYLAKELLARGWEVHYIREADVDGVIEVEGIVVHAIPKQRKLFKWRNWFHLRKAMRVIAADVWYVRANISYLPLVVWHSKRANGKTIWAFSRDSQFYYTKRNIKGRVLHNVIAQIDHFAFFRALKHVDKILLQTEFQKQLLSEKLRLSGEVIYNAHPIPNESASSKENIVVWIGRLQQFKHPERYLEIVRLLQDTPISFYLVGDSTNECIREEISRRSCALQNVQWVGKVGLEEVHRLLDISRVLVNTSDYEGFSNTFIEAWMRGVPVVSLFVDPDNFIANRKIGYVVGNISSAATRIDELVNDHELWRNISSNCIEFSRKSFNIVTAVDRLERCVFALGIDPRG